jgi:hypothetical protein
MGKHATQALKHRRRVVLFPLIAALTHDDRLQVPGGRVSTNAKEHQVPTGDRLHNDRLFVFEDPQFPRCPRPFPREHVADPGLHFGRVDAELDDHDPGLGLPHAKELLQHEAGLSLLLPLLRLERLLPQVAPAALFVAFPVLVPVRGLLGILLGLLFQAPPPRVGVIVLGGFVAARLDDLLFCNLFVLGAPHLKLLDAGRGDGAPATAHRCRRAAPRVRRVAVGLARRRRGEGIATPRRCEAPLNVLALHLHFQPCVVLVDATFRTENRDAAAPRHAAAHCRDFPRLRERVGRVGGGVVVAGLHHLGVGVGLDQGFWNREEIRVGRAGDRGPRREEVSGRVEPRQEARA